MSLMNAPKLSLASLVTLLLTVSSPSAVAYTGAGSGILRAQLCSSPAELLRAARGGDVESMRILGKMLIEGNGVKRDVKNGVKWIKMAAEQGDSGAMLMMGDLYRKGFGVPQDMDKAVEYYILADENGNKNAAKRIDKLSLKDSLPYWEKKVADGNKKATIKLMLAHATGDGIPKDLDKAKDLYELAKKKWPKAAEKALADLTEEQRTALVPPPPPAKPEPIVQTPTKPATPRTSAPVPSVTEWKYVRCDSKYCIDATQSKCEELYRYYLTQSNKQLYIIANDYNDDDVPVVAYKALCYFLLGESNRLTLMSKYGVTSAQLNREYGQLLSEFRELVTRIYKLCDQYPNSENSTTAIVMLTIIMDSHASTTPPDDLLKKCFAKTCESFLLLTDICLSNVQSSDDTGAAGLAWDFYLGYVYLNRYLQMNKPGLSHVADLKLYDERVDRISEECRRIKQANYYGSDDIKQAIIYIYGK